jgi:O-antigen/teichoic acid export membrane protein
MGAASFINICLRIISVKVLAVLLGPIGLGLIGMYNSILTTASNFASLGIGTSSVCYIAKARGKDDKALVNQVIQALGAITLLLALIGMISVFLLRKNIAAATFGDTAHAQEIGWLAMAVFVTVASTSMQALLQAFRFIGDQARTQILSCSIGTAVAICSVLLMGEKGILVFVTATPVAALVFGWHFAKKVPYTRTPWQSARIVNHIKDLIRMGVMVMIAGSFMSWGILFLLSKITKDFGLETTGIFQAAWSVSFVYMTFILDAMGRDYFPRLTEVADHNKELTRLINEQMHVALVLGAPVLISMIVFAPIIVRFLYSGSFQDAGPVIQWMTFGNLLKLVGWPMGFVVLSKGRSSLFLVTQVEWVALFLLLSWLGLSRFGIIGGGMAFAAAYVFHVCFVYFIVKWISGYKFSSENLVIAGVIGGVCGLLLFIAKESVVTSYILGCFVAATATVFSYLELKKMLGTSPVAVLKARLTP